VAEPKTRNLAELLAYMQTLPAVHCLLGVAEVRQNEYPGGLIGVRQSYLTTAGNKMCAIKHQMILVRNHGEPDEEAFFMEHEPYRTLLTPAEGALLDARNQLIQQGANPGLLPWDRYLIEERAELADQGGATLDAFSDQATPDP